MKKHTQEYALIVFQSEKILTSVRLAKLLASSERTARRRLKEWHAYRSYNMNGRYYVLPSIAKFDSSGMWKWKDVLFSSHGNLKETLLWLLDHADAGLSAAEVSDTLDLPAYRFLSQCHKDWKIPRKKSQGIYIYFSHTPHIFEKQRAERATLVHSHAVDQIPSVREALLILAEFIKHPAASPEQLARRVRRHGLVVGIDQVRNVLLQHKLVEKHDGFRAIEALNRHIEALGVSVSPKTLFPNIPTVHFAPGVSREHKHCSCGARLKVWKTGKICVTTLEIGPFIAHETTFKCDSCGKKYDSEKLRRLIPHACTFGFDVMIYCGKALFLRQRTIAEVMCELAEHNIIISSSEVSYLGQKFIVYLAIAHKESQGHIQHFMHQKGGYILHLDGMCEGGSPHVISVLDEISDFVLGNVKIPTENAAQIIPLLKDMKMMYGNPQAVVHDMGPAMLRAVAEIFPDVPDYICHFHFLRDLGNDLFGKEYALIRNRLKKHGVSTKLRYRLRYFEKEKTPLNVEGITHMITTQQFPADADASLLKSLCYVLILWALDGKNQGHGFGFPFDRPHLVLYQRLMSVYETLGKVEHGLHKTNSQQVNPLRQLSSALQPLIQDTDCQEVLPRLLQKIEVFDRLRTAMRMTLPDSEKGLNDPGTDVPMQTIEKGVKDFRDDVIKSKRAQTDTGYQKMIEQIDRYWEKLFADPLMVATPTGTYMIQPQRTNNLLEHFFRDYRKNYRRRSGNNTMTKLLQTMLADTLLVKNLENHDYLKILLRGRTSLAQRFAEIDSKLVRSELKKAKAKDGKIPSTVTKIIHSEKDMKSLLNAF